jgi:hypothetical protein
MMMLRIEARASSSRRPISVNDLGAKSSECCDQATGDNSQTPLEWCRTIIILFRTSDWGRPNFERKDGTEGVQFDCPALPSEVHGTYGATRQSRQAWGNADGFAV